MGAFCRRTISAILVLAALTSQAFAGQFEDDLLTLINSYRAAKRLKPLAMRPTYVVLAREESLEMLKSSRLSHDGFNVSFRKASASGANGCVENVGWNFSTVRGLFDGWQQSPEHDRNMLNPAITGAGIAKVGQFTTFFACY